MLVDGHAHIWSPDFERYPLGGPMHARGYTPLAGVDGSAEALRRQTQACGVDRAFQITPGFYGFDNSYTLDCLMQHSDWLAMGVLIDPLAADGPALLQGAVAAGVSGIRLQSSVSGPFDSPETTPMYEMANRLGVPVDCNGTHADVPAIAARARQFPDLRLICDHCGYGCGPLQKNTVDPVTEYLSTLPNVYAKVTFLEYEKRARI
eukprot:SAG22_NODE_4671_length_1198_cov_1.613285_2_plen_206_part_00